MARRPGRSRWERMLFSVMGPPELGDVSAPVPVLPERPAQLCTTCGRDRGTHEVVRTPTLTYTRCPGRPESSSAGAP